MNPAARLSALIELIDFLQEEWQQPQPRPAEQVFKFYTSKRRYIGGGDRRALQESLFTLLRGYGAAKAACEAHLLPLTGRSLALMHVTQRGEAVAALCEGGKYAPAALTDDEMAAIEKIAPTSTPVLPEWLDVLLRQQYGIEADALIEALMRPAAVDLRVNALQATPAEVIKSLQQEGIEAQVIKGLPNGLTISGRSIPLDKTKAYLQGWIEIQDRGSQAVIETLLQSDAIEGVNAENKAITILDYCAGAGGKTLALASAFPHQVKIIAHDIHAARLAELAPRAERAGVNNIHIWQKDAALLPQAEVILLDVPCSGTGTLRRHPDLAWRLTPEKVKEYSILQRSILRKAAEKLKPQGVMIYVTCSLLESENFQNVNDFLNDYPDFKVANLSHLWDKEKAKILQMLQFLPHREESDGFFMVVLKHKG